MPFPSRPSNPERVSRIFDFDFEGTTAKGFSSGGAGYDVGIDDSTAHSGKKSLRMSYVATPKPSAGEMKPEEAFRTCEEIVRRMQAQREEYAAKSSGKEADWAIQNARVVLQATHMEAGGAPRDRCMAENVKWILDQAPGSKVVLWAHNGHVGRLAVYHDGSMGYYLNEWYGKDHHVVIGFAGGEGQYTALSHGKLRSDNVLAPPPPGSVESYLRASGLPLFLLDLRKASPQSPGSAWLTESRPFRSIGALAMQWQFHAFKVCDLFDMLIYVDKTSPSRTLRD